MTRALLEAGIRWEEEVVRQRLAGRVLVPDGAGRITDRSFSIEETFNLLPASTPGRRYADDHPGLRPLPPRLRA